MVLQRKPCDYGKLTLHVRSVPGKTRPCLNFSSHPAADHPQINLKSVGAIHLNLSRRLINLVIVNPKCLSQLACVFYKKKAKCDSNSVIACT